ncbi:MAG TPA: DUF2809 domain-containing protein [Acetivibrio sp.]|jgi:hypothetical protein|nr:DUF2809 domain-containing protein [Clostridium sp.]HOQ36129.1 DUF2809 domain-containing protein [Acetivibrio sp.]HPT90906.1 DUF2809 domain-containing protein [Acetivibrio sp.]HQA57256.1 DUF2809 domain-containing protein [Acetivibrio sp.]
MKLNLKCLIVFFILLIVEIIIGVFVRDAIIRPYVGDILVVILMYAFIRGIIKKPVKYLPIYLFIFSCIVETAQYFRIVDILHLRKYKILSTIMGTSFDIKDILCYLIGTVILIIWERVERKINSTSKTSFLG